MNYIDSRTAAYLLGIPVRTLNHHVKVDGAPKVAYDKFDPAALIQWYASHMRERVREAQSGSSEKEARRRITLAKARIAEMDADLRAGELVEVAYAISEYEKVASIVRSQFLTMGGAMSYRLMALSDPVAIQKAIDDYVYNALTELSRCKLREQTENARPRWTQKTKFKTKTVKAKK